MSDLGYVYTLSDPRTGEVKYVGRTEDPHQRLESHLSSSPNGDLADWRESLQAEGLGPEMTVVAVTPAEQLRKKEAELISRLSEEWELLNKQRPRVHTSNPSDSGKAQQTPNSGGGSDTQAVGSTAFTIGYTLGKLEGAEERMKNDDENDWSEMIKEVQQARADIEETYSELLPSDWRDGHGKSGRWEVGLE